MEGAKYRAILDKNVFNSANSLRLDVCLKFRYNTNPKHKATAHYFESIYTKAGKGE